MICFLLLARCLWAGRVCKIHFAHAGQMFMMALCQITGERVFVDGIIGGRYLQIVIVRQDKRV